MLSLTLFNWCRETKIDNVFSEVQAEYGGAYYQNMYMMDNKINGDVRVCMGEENTYPSLAIQILWS